MGRPSKLTDLEWKAIGARLLQGHKAADLAREYGVSKTAISVRFSGRSETVRSVAKELVSAEVSLRKLNPTEQVAALSLAEELRSISAHLAGAAKYGAATAHRLAGIGHALVQEVDDADPLASMDALKAVAVITKMQNDNAHIGLNLLAANKDKGLTQQEEVPSDLGHFYGQ